ncbi:GNAT family N-acetyltransferase [Brevibacillus humidisoli]|uniref:GNAT family N-acetyltransferase n=1 Tax=Brevibacillus humidisoli TaxID=2895522 RepID=UPI001E43F3F3|nr:GNAT family N-acetyltransferase [Brevibacillus humidisoli]UFJ39236.1 GNAT family N-acetyltransferase [Brevibacillus humidisoli]
MVVMEKTPTETETETFAYERSYTAKNGKQITLRPAQSDDASAIIKRIKRVVNEGGYLEEEPDSIATTREEAETIREMKEQGSMYTVAVLDGEVVGVAQLKRGQLNMNAHVADFRIWVGPNYRGLGIGKQLMQYSIDWAEAHGLEKISLDVFSNNQLAVEMYKRYGFEVEGTRVRHFVIDGEYVDEIFMSKFL